MTLPSSGAITLAQVNTELGISSSAAISLNDSAVRTLFGKSSGAIAMSDGYGKSSGPTWDSAYKGANMSLSNGNMTVTGTTNNYEFVRATLSKSTDKWYWEITINQRDSVLDCVGIAATSTLPDSFLGYATGDYCYRADGVLVHNATLYSGHPTWTTGSVLGIALDLTGGNLTFYAPDGSVAYTFSGVSGAYFPAFGSNGYYTNIATANFGGSSFAHTVPSGYTAGFF